MSYYINASLCPEAYTEEAMDWLNWYIVGYGGSLSSTIGEYEGDEGEGSLFGKLSKVYNRSISAIECYPKYKPAITVTSDNYAWSNGEHITIIGNIKHLDNAAAVDSGGGLVRIPSTGHGFFPGAIVNITNTTNYNGNYVIDESAQINADWFNIPATYIAETFAGTEQVQDTVAEDYTKRFKLEGVRVSDISSVGEYELIIWGGPTGYEYEKARIPLSKTATKSTEGIIPITSSWMTGGRIAASLLASTGNHETVNIKLLFRRGISAY